MELLFERIARELESAEIAFMSDFSIPFAAFRDIVFGDAARDSVAPARGGNQRSLRLSNERLALSLTRLYGAMTKVELARLSGLSLQATTILNRLEAEGLMERREPVRGRVGQPTVPYGLAASGAYSLGLKVGALSAELSLIDFLGIVQCSSTISYSHLDLATVADFAARGSVLAVHALPARQRSRVTGMGVCWPNALRAHLDDFVRAALAEEDSAKVLARLPIFIANPAAAACAAELFLGRAPQPRRFAYFFVSAAVHGAVALNSSIHPGRSSLSTDGEGAGDASIRRASLTRLEASVREIGLDTSSIWSRHDAWPDYGSALNKWIEEAGAAIAQAALEAASIIDFETVIVDGIFPLSVRARLTRAAGEASARDMSVYATPIEVREGSVGPFAPSLGTAALPLLAAFSNGELGAGVEGRAPTLA
jgi:predicted NBD/HSP70 family sugar kinase